MYFFRLLVECFTKYCVIREAIRHFRGLKTFQGGTIALHNEGNFGDPLSLYLRALCREGIYQFFIVSDNKIFLVFLPLSFWRRNKNFDCFSCRTLHGSLSSRGCLVSLVRLCASWFDH